MSNKIKPPTTGEILINEYMKPANLSAYKLAVKLADPVFETGADIVRQDLILIFSNCMA